MSSTVDHDSLSFPPHTHTHTHTHTQSGEPFTDPDFPPANKSLYTDPGRPVARWRVARWERPGGTRDNFESEGIEWTVARDPRPEDIAQGVLGNCW